MRFFSAKCTSLTRLDGKTAVITGSNTGIGKCTARDFFERGARVIMVCRDVEKAQKAASDIKEQSKGKQSVGELVVMPLDLSSLNSVRKCAKAIMDRENRIDLLINNAGVMMCPLTRTEEGFEMQFGTNHLGHFLLTLLLLPKIIDSAPARIINVSSLAHTMTSGLDFTDLNWERRKYSSLGAYQASKLANVLFTKELSRKLKENGIEGVNVYSLHPGVIRTELGRHLGKTYVPGISWIWKNVCGWLIKTPVQGAQTTIYCAVDEKCANESGLYYSECSLTEPSKPAKDPESATKLWDMSLKLVGLDNWEFPKK